MKINSKKLFYENYQLGKFGNKLRTWSSLEDLKKDNFTNKLVIRTSEVGGGKCVYDVDLKDIDSVIKDWPNKHLIKYNESAPDHLLLWQGELQISIDHINLFYSDLKMKMRKALERGKHLEGLNAINMMKSTMTPNSYEDLLILLDRYDESVIELGVYSINLGNLPHRNTIIWEVRNY